jgi:hypothetical protein
MRFGESVHNAHGISRRKGPWISLYEIISQHRGSNLVINDQEASGHISIELTHLSNIKKVDRRVVKIVKGQ